MLQMIGSVQEKAGRSPNWPWFCGTNEQPIPGDLQFSAFNPKNFRRYSLAALMLGTGMGLSIWLHTYAGYILGVLFWTVGEILSYPIALALIAELSPPLLRGSYQGIYSSIRALSSLLAPALGGLIFEQLGPTALWSSCFVVSALIACGYLILNKLRQPQHIKWGCVAKTLRGKEGM